MVTNVKSFYKGQVIFKEGQKGSTAFMIQKGSVNIFRVVDNRKIITDRLGEGEIFGEMGALAGTARTHSAEAAEYTDLMVLTDQLVHNLLAKCPKTIQLMMRLLIKRLRKANDAQTETTHGSTFLSVCQLLEMAMKNHNAMPPAEARKIPNHQKGLGLCAFTRVAKGVLLVSQAEVEGIMSKLASLNAIELTSGKAGKAFTDSYIRLVEPDKFMQVASNIHKELGNDAISGDLEFVDIYDFSGAIEANPEILYRKMANMEIPESLFFFHRDRATSWAGEQDEGFFAKVKKKRKKIEECEDIDDLVFVDNATLKKVFARLGYYKLGILLTIAPEEAKKKITGNLAKKIATIVQQEAEGREFVDESEAEDIVVELFQLAREEKGVKG